MANSPDSSNQPEGQKANLKPQTSLADPGDLTRNSFTPQEQLNMALEATRMGTFEWFSETHQVVLSDLSTEVFGLLPGKPFRTSDEAFELVHPQDRAAYQALFEQAGAVGQDYETEYRIIRPRDGQLAWIAERGQGGRDPDTGAIYMRGVHWDITPRKRTENALRESDEWLRLATEASDIYWWQIDFATSTPIYSPNTEQIVGRPPAKTIEESLLMLHPDDRSIAAAAFEEALKNGTDRFNFQVRSIAIPTEIRWFTVSGTILRDAQGKPMLSIGISQNSTESKKAQEAIQASEARKTFLLKFSDSLRLLADPVDIQAMVTRKAMAYFGADRSYYCEIEGDKVIIRRDAYRPDLLSVAATYSLNGLPIFKSFCQMGSPLVVVDSATTELVDEELRQLCIQLNILAFINVPVMKEDQLVGNFCITQCTRREWTTLEVDLAQEIAERTWSAVEQARAEMAFRESEQHVRLTIEAARMGTWDWNLLTNEVVWNEEHFRLFNMEPRPNPVSPDMYFTHVHPEDRERVGRLLQEAIASRGVFDTEFCAVLEDGTQRWMSGYGRVIEEVAGEATRLSGVMFDVDKRKRAEDALRQADRRKDEFLALLAHELRNPLATLSNTLQLLELTGGQSPNLTLAMALTLMTREVSHLVRLVDDLLDVSRISQGKVSLSIERLDMVTLIGEAVEASQLQFRMANRNLSVSLPVGPAYLLGDAVRLRQVVSNLLHNALKFTSDGGKVWLSLSVLNDEAELRVRDDGIGIPPHELGRIFEMFAQVDTSLGRSQGGLGLGLTLVHELVNLHGGQVKAYSTGLGQGSEFLVSLPLLIEPREAQNLVNATGYSAPARHRVLMIDDNANAALTLSLLLELDGYDVKTAHSGQEGLQIAETFRPTVILCDISMPGMDGYETCRRIRQQPWGQSMFLIALTGYGQQEDKQRTKDAGFDNHLVKPVDITDLTTLLDELPVTG